MSVLERRNVLYNTYFLWQAFLRLFVNHGLSFLREKCLTNLMGQHCLYKCTEVDKNALYAKSTSDKFKTLSQSTSDRLSARRPMVFLFITRFFVCSFFSRRPSVTYGSHYCRPYTMSLLPCTATPCICIIIINSMDTLYMYVSVMSEINYCYYYYKCHIWIPWHW